MSLLVRPHSGVTFPGTYLLTRLVVGTGIMVTEVVTGVDRVIVHIACVLRCVSGKHYNVSHSDGGESIHVGGCFLYLCFCLVPQHQRNLYL